MLKLRVLHPEFSNRIVGHMPEEQARRLLRLGQARRVPGGRAIQLLKPHELPAHPCNTFTGRVYTVKERSRVSRFKTIQPEDLHLFHQATLDCVVKKAG